MSPVLGVVLLLLGLAVGGAIGFLLRQRQDTALLVRAQAEADALRRSSQDEAQRLLEGAQRGRDDLLRDAQTRADRDHVALRDFGLLLAALALARLARAFRPEATVPQKRRHRDRSAHALPPFRQ